jgi:hypothetical protein
VGWWWWGVVCTKGKELGPWGAGSWIGSVDLRAGGDWNTDMSSGDRRESVVKGTGSCGLPFLVSHSAGSPAKSKIMMDLRSQAYVVPDLVYDESGSFVQVLQQLSCIRI